jgi:hypothetical protein
VAQELGVESHLFNSLDQVKKILKSEDLPLP